MKNKYEILESKVVFKGTIFTVRVDKVRMPQGNVVEREVISHFGAVGIVPLTPDEQVILVKQYRHATQKYLIEIPAGKLLPKEDPYLCAVRELKEETGITSARMVKLAEFYNSPGYSSERFHLYLAEVKSQGEVDPDGDEELEMEVVKMPLQEGLKLIDKGEICDAKSIIGLLMTDRWLKINK